MRLGQYSSWLDHLTENTLFKTQRLHLEIEGEGTENIHHKLKIGNYAKPLLMSEETFTLFKVKDDYGYIITELGDTALIHINDLQMIAHPIP